MKYDLESINAALTALGAEPIEDIEQDCENARRVKRVYPMKLKSTLRKHFWNFALKEARLSRLVGTPLMSGYSAMFQLPPDYIRIKNTSLDEFGGESYKIKGRAIYCNADSLIIEYVWFCDDPNMWDAEFKEAFSAAIADVLAYPITVNATMAGTVKTEAKNMLRLAKSSDSVEETPDQPKRGSWVRGR